MSQLILDTNLIYQNRENSNRKLSIKSNITERTIDESITIDNYIEKRHVNFRLNFIDIIDIESWKEYICDVTEIDAEWVKVEPEKKVTTKNNDIINKKTINNNNHIKYEKISCQCNIF